MKRGPPAAGEPHGRTLYPDDQHRGHPLHVVLEPFSEEDMEAYEVSRLVNSPRNNSPACLELVERE
jgi:putative SOS response-associated peptidase YedK